MKQSLPLVALMAALIAWPASASAYCREFTKEIVIGGETVQGYGTSCLQPDGSWQIQSDARPVPPLQPQQVQPMPAPAPAPTVVYPHQLAPTTLVIREQRYAPPPFHAWPHRRVHRSHSYYPRQWHSRTRHVGRNGGHHRYRHHGNSSGIYFRF